MFARSYPPMPLAGDLRKRIIVAICLAVAALHFVVGPAYGGPYRAFVASYLV